jgi:hypothetical protein
MGEREFFLSFIDRTTRWWLVLPAYSLWLSAGVDNWFLLVIFLPWVAVKVIAWRKTPPLGTETVAQPAGNTKPVPWLKFALAIAVLTIPAYVVSKWGPDNRSFFKDLPYQAARESGMSRDEALRAVPQIAYTTPLPNGLFLTTTGWTWFLTLELLYGWRAYRWLTRRAVSGGATQSRRSGEW